MSVAFAEVSSVVQEAFYLLRQDASVVTAENWTNGSPIEIAKAKLAIETAAHEVFDSYEWADTSLTAERVSVWPSKMRNALVYCLARELAIPLAGRTEDMKNFDALYRDKLRAARVADLSANLDKLADNFVLPFVFATTIEDTSVGAQVRDMWKFSLGSTLVDRVNRRISAVTVKTHYSAAQSGSQQISLAVIAVDKTRPEDSKRTLIAVSKNTVVFTPNSLVTWQFEDFTVPAGCYIECQPIRGATTLDVLAEKYREFGWEYDRNVNYSVHLSLPITDADAEDYSYLVQSSTSTRICPQVRLYSYETGATSLYQIAQRVLRRVFPFVIGNTEQPLPYSIKQFANTINEASVSAQNAVKKILGVDSLDAVGEQAAEMLATSNVAPVLGLDANFAQIRLKEYERLIADAQKTAINTAITSTEDPAIRETLAQLLTSIQDGFKTSHGVGTLVKLVGDLADRARQEVLMAHKWNFATMTEEVGVGVSSSDGLFRYPYPRQCLRLTSLVGERYDDVEWRVVNGLIEARAPIFRISYTRDVKDITRWPALAKNLYALKLKALAALELGDPNSAALHEGAYTRALEDAKLRDTRESNSPSDAWGENYYVEKMRSSRRVNPFGRF